MTGMENEYLDKGDAERLRHARDRHGGFPVGRYLQPPPMLFTRDGHNVPLGDMYRGHTAFLICAGPSLSTHDLTQLDQRGILTCAVNNAATVFRPNLWVSVDNPGNFSDAIWRDPAILKFVPLCHMEKTFMERDEDEELIPSREVVGDMPCVFGYRRNERFVAEQWLYEDTFNWGNHGEVTDAHGLRGSRSVMLVAIRMLFFLGVRRIYLLGCDFKMRKGTQNYAFKQDRSSASVRGNNNSYRTLNVRLKRLLPFFEKEDFDIYNCTPDSGLLVFPHVSFEEAINEATSVVPARINTSGMYDLEAKKKQATKEPAQNEVGTYHSETFDPTELPELTLLTAIDRTSLPTLKWTWPTWIRHRLCLADTPIVVLHDESIDPDHIALDFLREHGNISFHQWSAPSIDRRNRWTKAYFEAASQHIETPWYLKLEPEAIAVRQQAWIFPQWFQSEKEKPPPAFIASPWGYTKPSSMIRDLDDWADGVDGLDRFPRVDLPFSEDCDRICHNTISSWCFFGNTQWTQEVSQFIPDELPCQAHDTLAYFLAARRGDSFRRIPMKEHGWEHSFSKTRSLPRRCRQVIGNMKEQAT